MKAIAVFPGKADSVHLADMPKPSLDTIPHGRVVLVRVLRVGVDGTDSRPLASRPSSLRVCKP